MIMVNFNEIKKICYEHDECLKKTKGLEALLKSDNTIGATTYGYSVELSKNDIRVLLDVISKRGIELERRILELTGRNS